MSRVFKPDKRRSAERARKNRDNLARGSFNLGHYEHSIKWYDKELEIIETALPEDRTDAASALNNKGAAYNRLDMPDEALDSLKKARNTFKDAPDADPLVAAAIYNNMGIALNKKGDPDEALKYHKMALGIRRRELGEHHPDVAASFTNIGLAYENDGNDDEARKWLDRAKQTVEEENAERYPKKTPKTGRGTTKQTATKNVVKSAYEYVGGEQKPVSDNK